MISSDNNRFLRLWFEVGRCKTAHLLESNTPTLNDGIKWVSYNKGGSFRKWGGNREYLVNWQNGGKDVIEYNAKLYGSASRQICPILFSTLYKLVIDYFYIVWS